MADLPRMAALPEGVDPVGFSLGQANQILKFSMIGANNIGYETLIRV